MKRLCIVLVVFLASVSMVFAGAEGPGISAAKALDLLKEGNARFVKGKADYPNQDFTRRDQTATKGQAPFVSVLSCSDSRVPVEILFDRGVGDIFVIRVAGNVSNTDEMASLEYGTDHLGAPLLLVLGHSGCGAVTAVVNNEEVHGHIPTLVKPIIPAVKTAKEQNPSATGNALITEAIKANIWQAIGDMLTNSPIIAERVKQNKLEVIGAYYELETGKVSWLGNHPKQKELLESAKKGH
jgi:carbonic anhydrase